MASNLISEEYLDAFRTALAAAYPTNPANMAKDVTIKREGTQIILPPKMEYQEAIEWMQRKMKEDEVWVGVSHTINAYPLDGAYAFTKAVKEIYGWSSQHATLVAMAVDATHTVQVPWGAIKIPGIEGELSTGLDCESNPPQFVINGKVRAKHREQILALYEKTKQIIATDSVYRGKAIRVDYDWVENDYFNPVRDNPTFIDVSRVNENDLVFEAQTEKIIRMTLFALIEKAPLMRKFGVPLKKGVLFAGNYGTGKTLTANVTAKLAVQNGFTFIYLKNAHDLANGLALASQYSPAVVFAEDIDRVMSGQRTAEIDQILNTLDGVDTKNHEIITVLTTNHLDQINPALLRPGRLDAIVPINEPDAPAVIRLIKTYGNTLLSHDFDYDLVGNRLAGNIPAVIRECVERAKAAAIDRLNGDITGRVEAEDVLLAAEAMQAQIKMITPEKIDTRPPLERFGLAVGRELGTALKDAYHGNGTH